MLTYKIILNGNLQKILGKKSNICNTNAKTILESEPIYM